MRTSGTKWKWQALPVALAGLASLFSTQAFASTSAGGQPSPEHQVFQFLQRGTYIYTADDVITAAAYLWIPEHCRRLRGLLILGQNMPEQRLVGHPAIRAVCAENDLGIVWCAPTFISYKKRDEAPKTIAFLQQLLDGLAKQSGYAEVATVPWLPMGESMHLRMVKQLLNEAPERCIAGICIKNALGSALTNRETPVLMAVGTAQEWFQDESDIRTRWQDLSFYDNILKRRAASPAWPVSVLIEGGSGHFDCTEAMTSYFAAYISAAVRARLPAEPGGELRPVRPNDGFVAGLPLPGRKTFKPIAYAQANPAHRLMPWFFNEALARDAYRSADINWKASTQFLAFLDAAGHPVPMAYQGITRPVPIVTGRDGITFEIRGGVLPAIPEHFVGAGAPLAVTPGAPEVEWVCGPVAPLGGGKFRLSMGRTWYRKLACVVLRKRGTADIRDAVQPGYIVPEPNTDGFRQTITFERIPDQMAGAVSVPLVASADSGMQVRFFVVAGPAVVEGDTLKLTPLPPRTRFPVAITVTAWQWGRSIEPRVQTAEPVTRTFYLLPANGS